MLQACSFFNRLSLLWYAFVIHMRRNSINGSEIKQSTQYEKYLHDHFSQFATQRKTPKKGLCIAQTHVMIYTDICLCAAYALKEKIEKKNIFVTR